MTHRDAPPIEFATGHPTPASRRRRLLAAAGAGLTTGLLPVGRARAQAWPSKPLRIIAAQAPGASNDATARTYAEYFSSKLGVSCVVENKPGGVGMIASEIVARSAPDGTTFLVILHSQLAQAPVLLKKVPIDTSKDLIPIAALSTGTGLGVVKKDLPVNSMKELVEYSKTRPVSVGNYGVASGWQLMMTQVARQTGARFDIVNYKGTGPMLADLLAGQIDVGGGSLVGLTPGLQRGSIRPLVITYGGRSKKLPAVPTWADEGFVGPAFQSLAECNMLLAPAGTPAEITNRLAQLAAESATQSPRMKTLIDNLGLDEGPVVGEELRRFIDRVWPAFRSLTRELNLTLDT